MFGSYRESLDVKAEKMPEFTVANARLCKPVARAASVVPLDSLKRLRRRVQRGRRLFCAGDPFSSLFVVRLGFFKSLAFSDDGQMHVTDFPMAGDLVGLDGIYSGHHQCEVVAIDDAEAFVVPFAECEQWAHECAYGQRLMTQVFAHEIARCHDLIRVLATAHAAQKVAIFLLDMSSRYARLGYSPSQFILRMTRQDIGSYLGLKLETVSRILAHLQRQGLIQVQGKSIALLDPFALRQLSGDSTDTQRPTVDAILDHEGELRHIDANGYATVSG